MSMLIRTGTIIRKPTRKSSVRRTKSAGSAVPGSHTRALDKGDQPNTTYSVPTSPVAKLHQQLYTEQSLNNSPAKASVTTTTSTIVSYDDSRLAYKTCIDRTVSCDTGTGNQDTVVQIQEASNDAENVCDFLCTASQIVCSSTFITSAVGLSMIIPVVMIVFGVKYLDECPIQPRIPIFHMVGGCFGVLKVAVTLYRSVQRRHQGSSDNIYDTVGREGGIHHRTYRTLDIILSVFLLSWHILGTVWVFRIWKPLFQPLLHRPDMWCERSLYLFSIAIIVGVDTVIVLALLGMACLACFYRTNIITSGGAVDR